MSRCNDSTSHSIRFTRVTSWRCLFPKWDLLVSFWWRDQSRPTNNYNAWAILNKMENVEKQRRRFQEGSKEGLDLIIQITQIDSRSLETRVTLVIWSMNARELTRQMWDVIECTRDPKQNSIQSNHREHRSLNIDTSLPIASLNREEKPRTTAGSGTRGWNERSSGFFALRFYSAEGCPFRHRGEFLHFYRYLRASLIPPHLNWLASSGYYFPAILHLSIVRSPSVDWISNANHVGDPGRRCCAIRARDSKRDNSRRNMGTISFAALTENRRNSEMLKHIIDVVSSYVCIYIYIYICLFLNNNVKSLWFLEHHFSRLTHSLIINFRHYSLRRKNAAILNFQKTLAR